MRGRNKYEVTLEDRAYGNVFISTVHTGGNYRQAHRAYLRHVRMFKRSNSHNLVKLMVNGNTIEAWMEL